MSPHDDDKMIRRGDGLPYYADDPGSDANDKSLAEGNLRRAWIGSFVTVHTEVFNVSGDVVF